MRIWVGTLLVLSILHTVYGNCPAGQGGVASTVSYFTFQESFDGSTFDAPLKKGGSSWYPSGSGPASHALNVPTNYYETILSKTYVIKPVGDDDAVLIVKNSNGDPLPTSNDNSIYIEANTNFYIEVEMPCTDCTNLTFNADGIGVCEDCPTGWAPNADNTACDVCAAGQEPSPSGCTECATGKYADVSALAACKDCPTGYTSHSSHLLCTLCPVGECGRCDVGFEPGEETYRIFVQQQDDSTFIIANEAPTIVGTYDVYDVSGGEILQMSVVNDTLDKTHHPRSIHLENIYGDTIPLSNWSLTSVSGSFNVVEQNHARTLEVTTNTYLETAEEYMWSASVQLVIQYNENCKMCAPGSFSFLGVTCDPCTVGRISSHNANSCTACGVNQYANIDTCEACPDSSTSFGNISSSDDCLCNAGEEMQNDACTSCAPGEFSSDGDTCDACPGGWTSTSGSASCDACPANQYANGNECLACPGNSSSPEGSDNLFDCICNDGFEDNGVNTGLTHLFTVVCDPCTAGKYSTGGVQCADCPVGFASEASASSCAPCPANQYEYERTCRECPAGTTSSANSSGFNSCFCTVGEYLQAPSTTLTFESTKTGTHVCSTLEGDPCFRISEGTEQLAGIEYSRDMRPGDNVSIQWGPTTSFDITRYEEEKDNAWNTYTTLNNIFDGLTADLNTNRSTLSASNKIKQDKIDEYYYDENKYNAVLNGSYGGNNTFIINNANVTLLFDATTFASEGLNKVFDKSVINDLFDETTVGYTDILDDHNSILYRLYSNSSITVEEINANKIQTENQLSQNIAQIATIEYTKNDLQVEKSDLENQYNEYDKEWRKHFEINKICTEPNYFPPDGLPWADTLIPVLQPIYDQVNVDTSSNDYLQRGHRAVMDAMRILNREHYASKNTDYDKDKSPLKWTGERGSQTQGFDVKSTDNPINVWQWCGPMPETCRDPNPGEWYRGDTLSFNRAEHGNVAWERMNKQVDGSEPPDVLEFYPLNGFTYNCVNKHYRFIYDSMSERTPRQNVFIMTPENQQKMEDDLTAFYDSLSYVSRSRIRYQPDKGYNFEVDFIERFLAPAGTISYDKTAGTFEFKNEGTQNWDYTTLVQKTYVEQILDYANMCFQEYNNKVDTKLQSQENSALPAQKKLWVYEEQYPPQLSIENERCDNNDRCKFFKTSFNKPQCEEETATGQVICDTRQQVEFNPDLQSQYFKVSFSSYTENHPDNSINGYSRPLPGSFTIEYMVGGETKQLNDLLLTDEVPQECSTAVNLTNTALANRHNVDNNISKINTEIANLQSQINSKATQQKSISRDITKHEAAKNSAVKRDEILSILPKSIYRDEIISYVQNNPAQVYGSAMAAIQNEIQTVEDAIDAFLQSFNESLEVSRVSDAEDAKNTAYNVYLNSESTYQYHLNAREIMQDNIVYTPSFTVDSGYSRDIQLLVLRGNLYSGVNVNDKTQVGEYFDVSTLLPNTYTAASSDAEIVTIEPYWAHPSSTCTACPLGRYNDGSGYFCSICPAGKTSNNASTGCVNCAGGKYTRGLGICHACEVGTYSASGDATCSTCPVGYYSEGGWDACTTCKGTYRYTDEEGQGNCTKACNATNQVSQGPRCETCPYGEKNATHCKCNSGYFPIYTLANSGPQSIYDEEETPGTWTTTCHACLNGREADGETEGISVEDNPCVCPAGKFAPTRHDNCTDCPTGKYQDQKGQISCKDKVCPPGQESGVSLTINDCSNCAAGKYSPTGGRCFPARIGYFQAEEGQTTDEKCTGQCQGPRLSDRCTCGQFCPSYSSLPGSSKCYYDFSGEYYEGGTVSKDQELTQCIGAGDPETTHNDRYTTYKLKFSDPVLVEFEMGLDHSPNHVLEINRIRYGLDGSTDFPNVDGTFTTVGNRRKLTVKMYHPFKVAIYSLNDEPWAASQTITVRLADASVNVRTVTWYKVNQTSEYTGATYTVDRVNVTISNQTRGFNGIYPYEDIVNGIRDDNYHPDSNLLTGVTQYTQVVDGSDFYLSGSQGLIYLDMEQFPNRACETCDSSKWLVSLNNGRSCYRCPRGKMLNANHTDCVTVPENKYGLFNEVTAHDCPAGSTSAEGTAETIEDCICSATGYSVNAVTGACECLVPGYSMDSGTCACDQWGYTNATGECTCSWAGYAIDASTGTCGECNDGEVVQNGVCVDCQTTVTGDYFTVTDASILSDHPLLADNLFKLGPVQVYIDRTQRPVTDMMGNYRGQAYSCTQESAQGDTTTYSFIPKESAPTHIDESTGCGRPVSEDYVTYYSGKTNNVLKTKCETCVAGKYSLHGVCTDCPRGRVSLNSTGMYGSGSTACTRCERLKESFDGGVTCSLCPAGRFYSDATTFCETCVSGQVQAQAGQTECETCPNGEASNAERTACVACEEGEYAENDVCTTCPVGYFSSTATRITSGACQECSAGRFANETGMNGCFACVGGTYQEETGQSACVQCPDGVTGPAGASREELCHHPCGVGNNEEGELSGDGSACLTCGTGYKRVNGTCEECPANYLSSEVDDYESCHAFSCGLNQRVHDRKCEDCPTGKIGSGSTCVPLVKSMNGLFFSNVGFDSSCPPGTYVGNIEYDGARGVACYPCAKGFFSMFTNSERCQRCPNGRDTLTTGASSYDDCVYDAAMCERNQTTGLCSICKPHFVLDNGFCKRCPVGETSNMDSTQCVSVVCDEPGQVVLGHVCEQCASGRWNNAEDTVCYDITKPCSTNHTPVFYYAPQSDDYDLITEVIDEIGNDFTHSDFRDRFGHSTQVQACEACNMTEMVSMDGTCVKVCPRGYEPIHGVCTPCEINYYGPSPGYCFPCPSYTYTFERGSHECLELCPPGQGMTDTYTCELCPPGKYSDQPSTECHACPKGTFANENGTSTCTPCQDWSWDGTTLTAANSHELGFPAYADERGLTACKLCEPGKAAGLKQACVSCPDKMISNSTGCVPCPENTEYVNGICEPCTGNDLTGKPFVSQVWNDIAPTDTIERILVNESNASYSAPERIQSTSHQCGLFQANNLHPCATEECDCVNNLNGSVLNGTCVVEYQDLSEKILSRLNSTVFQSAYFLNCKFGDLRGVTFGEVTMSECDFEGALIDASTDIDLTKAYFDDCTGIFYQCDHHYCLNIPNCNKNCNHLPLWGTKTNNGYSTEILDQDIITLYDIGSRWNAGSYEYGGAENPTNLIPDWQLNGEISLYSEQYNIRTMKTITYGCQPGILIVPGMNYQTSTCSIDWGLASRVFSLEGVVLPTAYTQERHFACDQNEVYDIKQQRCVYALEELSPDMLLNYLVDYYVESKSFEDTQTPEESLYVDRKQSTCSNEVVSGCDCTELKGYSLVSAKHFERFAEVCGETYTAGPDYQVIGCDNVVGSLAIEDTCASIDEPHCSRDARACQNCTKGYSICGVCGGRDEDCGDTDCAYDICGVCGGDGTTCLGCDNVPLSGRVNDKCGQCDGLGLTCYNSLDTLLERLHPHTMKITPGINEQTNIDAAEMRLVLKEYGVPYEGEQYHRIMSGKNIIEDDYAVIRMMIRERERSYTALNDDGSYDVFHIRNITTLGFVTENITLRVFTDPGVADSVRAVRYPHMSSSSITYEGVTRTFSEGGTYFTDSSLRPLDCFFWTIDDGLISIRPNTASCYQDAVTHEWHLCRTCDNYVQTCAKDMDAICRPDIDCDQNYVRIRPNTPPGFSINLPLENRWSYIYKPKNVSNITDEWPIFVYDDGRNPRTREHEFLYQGPADAVAGETFDLFEPVRCSPECIYNSETIFDIYLDQCNVCGGANECLDCYGVINGTAEADACGVCEGDNSTCSDCEGVPYGNARFDTFGVCNGRHDGYNLRCDCARNNVENCFHVFRNRTHVIYENYTAMDACGVCGGDSTSCQDCTGIPNGPNKFNQYGECAGNFTIGPCQEVFSNSTHFYIREDTKNLQLLENPNTSLPECVECFVDSDCDAKMGCSSNICYNRCNDLLCDENEFCFATDNGNASCVGKHEFCTNTRASYVENECANKCEATNASVCSIRRNDYMDTCTCTTCDDGEIYLSRCQLCDAGTYAANSYECKRCPINAFSTAGSNTCTEHTSLSDLNCYPDEYVVFGNATHDTRCQRCSNNTIRAPNPFTCMECPEETAYDPVQRRCMVTACNAGSYMYEDECQPCAAGLYLEVDGVEANSSETMCKQCVAGSYSDAGAAFCTACPKGFAQNLDAQSACVECAAGTYADRFGMESCDLCEYGFVSEAGAAVCIECPGRVVVPNRTVCGACSGSKVFDFNSDDTCIECTPDIGCNSAGASVTVDRSEYDGTTKISGPNVAHRSFNCPYDTSNQGNQGTCIYKQHKSHCESHGKRLATFSEIDDSMDNLAVDNPVPFEGIHVAVYENGFVGLWTEAKKASGKNWPAHVPNTGSYPNGWSSAYEFFHQGYNYNIAYNDVVCAKDIYSNCAAGTYFDSSSSKCQTCAVGKVSENYAAACTCPSGTHIDGIGCDTCAAGTYGDEIDLSTCKDCPTGQYQDQTGQTSCKTCASGYKPTNGQLGCEQCNETLVRTEFAFNDCDYTCNTGSYVFNDGAACNGCPRGFYSDLNNSVSCKTCPAGWVPRGDVTYDGISNDIYSDAGAALNFANRCEQCPAGKVTVTNENTDGTIITSMYCGIEQCPTGEGLTDGECGTCSAGRYLFNNVCEECPTGYKNPSTGQTSCTACSARTHQDETGQTACKDCSAGRYQDQNAQANCKPCAIGHFQSQSGQRDCDDQCIPGTYQDTQGQSSCKNCAAGKYQDQYGTTFCKSCSTGKHQDQTGQTSCKNCATGRYQDQISQTSCINCVAGTYQDQSSQTSCKTCPSGWNSDAGQGSCTDPNADPCDGAGLTNGVANSFCKTLSNVVCTAYTKFAFATRDSSGTVYIGGGISDSTNPAYTACPTTTCNGMAADTAWTMEDCRQQCIGQEWCDTFNFGIGHTYVGRCALYADCNLQTSSQGWEGLFDYVPLDCRSTGTASGHRCG